MLDEHDHANVKRRLRKVAGQVGALSRMVDDHQYCVDTLQQIAAVQGALTQIARIILGSHLKTCVTDAFDSEDGAEAARVITELEDVFSRFLRR